MAAENWARIKQLFDRAIQLNPGERSAYLDEACGRDHDVREQVESLLESDSDTETFLEQPVLKSVLGSDEDDIPVDYFIGPYHLTKVIGSGSMGIVYEALQEKPKRTVAVKVMKEGIVTKEALQRFEYEAQILARLDHPNIAHVIEAGTHRSADDALGRAGEGIPFFVMEYIEGAEPITSYVHNKKLSTRERIELFQNVCQAVHHGHLRGVIHRDLKPSNILVSAQGQVKVIDFGVARAAGRDMADTMVRTEVGQLIGTLRYMSPEQCKADPNDLDVRSDVYALAVILFEMLLDALPYDLESSTLYETVRVILEEPPIRPRVVNRSIHHDLETILLKALEKDRGNRYQNVLDLSHDLDRFLRGEVILAKPAGMALRFSKWVKRNPVLSTAMAISVISLGVLLLYVFFWYNPRIRMERDKAEIINQFLVEMIESPDPSVEGIDVKVVDILEKAAGKVGDTFAGQPDIKVALQTTLGRTFMALGQYVSAEEQFRGAKQILDEYGTDDEIDMLGTRFYISSATKEQHQFTEAEALYRALLDDCQSSLGPEHSLTLEVKLGLASTYFYQWKLPDAAKHLEEVIATSSRVFGEKHKLTLNAMSTYARVLRELGRYAEAEEAIKQVIEQRLRTLGEENLYTLNAMECLGNLLRRMERYEEAEEIARNMLEIQRRVLGEDHPHTLSTLTNLASTLEAARRYDEAEAIAREVLEIERRARGEDQNRFANSLIQLATILRNRGKLSEAETYARQAVEMYTGLLGPDDGKTLEVMQFLASLVKRLGNLDEAERLNRLVLEKQRKLLGNENRGTLVTMNNLANVLVRKGKLDEAEKLYDEVLEKQRKVLAPVHTNTLRTIRNLAWLYREQERYAESESLLREILALETSGKSEEEENYGNSSTRAGLAYSLECQARLAEAEEHYRIVMQTRERILGIAHTSTLESVWCLARVLKDQGKMEQAEPLFLKIPENYTKLKGLEHENTQKAIMAVVEFYEAWGKIDTVAEWKNKLTADN